MLSVEMSDSATSFEIDETDLLQACPCCTYSLRGLPEQHRCPECGLEVDRRWEVFGGPLMPAESRRSMKPVMILIGIVMLMVMEPLLRIGRNMLGTNPWLALLWFVLMLTFPSTYLVALLQKPKHFIAAGPDGLVIYRGRKGLERYDWSEVGKMRHDLARKSLVIEAGGRDRRCRFYKFFGWHITEADRCVRGVNQYPRGRKA